LISHVDCTRRRLEHTSRRLRVRTCPQTRPVDELLVSDAIVLRLYDSYGGRGVARVRLTAPFAEAHRANLLEEDGEALVTEDGAIVVPFRPREVATVLVT
jgi:alpha-mannosidase